MFSLLRDQDWQTWHVWCVWAAGINRGGGGQLQLPPLQETWLQAHIYMMITMWQTITAGTGRNYCLLYRAPSLHPPVHLSTQPGHSTENQKCLNQRIARQLSVSLLVRSSGSNLRSSAPARTWHSWERCKQVSNVWRCLAMFNILTMKMSMLRRNLAAPSPSPCRKWLLALTTYTF